MRGPGPRRADRLPGAEPACGDPGGAGALAGSARTCAFAGAAEAASFSLFAGSPRASGFRRPCRVIGGTQTARPPPVAVFSLQQCRDRNYSTLATKSVL